MNNNLFNVSISGLYKKSSRESRAVAAGLFLIVVLFLLLHPRLLVMAFPFVKESKIERFVKQTQASDTFDLTKYWQLRDMVGGVYTYNPATIEPHSILHIKKLTSDTNHLLTNESQEFISKEYLVSGSVKDAELAKMLPGKVLFQDQGSVITYDELQRKLYIRSLYPFEEMKRHNGAVDYQVLEEDLSNYFWLITTEITVSPTFSV